MINLTTFNFVANALILKWYNVADCKQLYQVV